MRNIIEGNIVDPVSNETFQGKLIVENGIIKKVERCPVDSDLFILPGLVDAHVHIESSMVTPRMFAAQAVKSGTVATVSDPHEIANVLGVKGVEYMLADAEKVPFKFNFGVPSCVPATDLESAGAVLDSKKVHDLLKRKEMVCLSEMMNFPGVIYDDSEVHKKIKYALDLGKPVDGHAPGLVGEGLVKYASAGITTDHECSTIAEAEAKIKEGMKIQIREGSAAKNFDALWTLIDSHPDSVMLCSDDLHPDDLIKGHVNLLLKRCIALGLDLYHVLRSATVNPVKHYNLNVGLLQQGDPADFIVVKDLVNFEVVETFIDGISVFKDKKSLISTGKVDVINRFDRKKMNLKDMQLHAESEKVNAIHAFEGDLLTKSITLPITKINSLAVSNLENDCLKVIVVNRYDDSAEPAIGFIHGFGLKKGAIASSVAHDSHNIIAVGTSDQEILDAINTIVDSKGGIAVVNGEEVSLLSLPIAGLMSDLPVIEVAHQYEALNAKAKEIGAVFRAPFMTLAFMSLLVIPELKLGDKGLFDGLKFKKTNLFV